MTRLRTEPIAKASADQRAGPPAVSVQVWPGACGRRSTTPPAAPSPTPRSPGSTSPGSRSSWPPGAADAGALPWLDPPPARTLAEGRRSCSAPPPRGDGDGRITATGRGAVALPLHPRLARMVVDAPRATPGACVLARSSTAATSRRRRRHHPPPRHGRPPPSADDLRRRLDRSPLGTGAATGRYAIPAPSSGCGAGGCWRWRIPTGSPGQGWAGSVPARGGRRRGSRPVTRWPAPRSSSPPTSTASATVLASVSAPPSNRTTCSPCSATRSASTARWCGTAIATTSSSGSLAPSTASTSGRSRAAHARATPRRGRCSTG